MYKEFLLDDGRHVCFDVTKAVYGEYIGSSNLCVVQINGTSFIIQQSYENMKIYANGGTP